MAITLNFDKKVVFITGGSSGIGRACVKLFAEAGARVAFSYGSNDAAAKGVIDELKNFSVYGTKIELTSEKDVVEKTGEIRKLFGSIDILVNNAGIWKRGDIDTMSIDEWKETIDINLTGTFLITREVSKYMKLQNSGRIINIASTAGQRGEPHYSHYAASKGALISMTKSLAVELAPSNITVNCVAPGWVATRMTDHIFNDPVQKEKIEKAIPRGKIASAEDIAGPVLFLASQLADHITGEILNVNGGSVLCG